MDTRQLHAALQNLPLASHVLGGVLPADRLPPRVTDKPKLYVVNTDPSHLPGKHWTAFYFPRDAPAEYFDSLGKKPLPEFQQFLEENSNHGYMYNKKRLQGYKTNSCGHFCLFYATYRCQMNLSMENIIGKLSDNLEENDIRMREFVYCTFHLTAPLEEHIPNRRCVDNKYI